MKTMKQADEAVEKRRNGHGDKALGELLNNPAGAFGVVDTILNALVAQEVEDEDCTILSEICNTVITKARTGDIGACRLLFDRISGAPVTFMCAMGQEEEVPTEIGIS